MFDGERKKMRVESRRSLITLGSSATTTFAEAKPLPLMRVLQSKVGVLTNGREAISCVFDDGYNLHSRVLDGIARNTRDTWDTLA